MKSKKIKILVFPGGTEVALEINKALKDCKDIVLYSATVNVSNHSSYVFKNNFIISSIKSRTWIDELNRLVVRKKIDYIYPAYDDIIIALAENRQRIKTKIIIPPLKTCLITRSKKETYNEFKNILPVPKVFQKSKDVKNWPIFLKPEKGQGSQNTYKVNDIKELNFYLKRNKEMLMLEYLPGREYTIDCFSDRKRGLLFCGGRERIRTKNGISMNSKIISNKLWRKYAQLIMSKLKIYGAWFFQMKEDKFGKLKLLEIAPRISGTMAVNRVRGINFPLLSIYEQERLDLKILVNDYKTEIDRALINRYQHHIKYNKIYVDFDDTIIINNRVNMELVSLLYQWLNEGKKIYLITKSKEDIRKKLKKYAISEKIFNKIIHLKKKELKINHIQPHLSIFIDDSFRERKIVADKYKIRTFDCSMLELLKNYKV